MYKPAVFPHKASSTEATRLSVGFVLLPEFTLVAFSAFVDSLRLAADYGDRSRQIRCKWTVLGEPGQPVRASCGLDISPNEGFGDPRRFDYVVVVGGLLHGILQGSQALYSFIQSAAALEIPIVGLCTATFALARAGVLDGHKSCVSWYHRNDFLSLYPDQDVISDELFVVDRNRLTCAGGTSVVHLAAHIIEKRFGKAEAHKSLRIMIEGMALPAQTPQPTALCNHQITDRRIRKAMTLIEENMGENLLLQEIAQEVNLSPRQLERNFSTQVGLTPYEFWMRLRLNHANWLLENTTRPVIEIAEECGFTSNAHFSRRFRSVFGHPPSQVRQRNAPVGKRAASPIIQRTDYDGSWRTFDRLR